jgi:hypothetical protein
VTGAHLAAGLAALLAGAAPPAQQATYARVIGDDWRGYRTTVELRERMRFFSFDRTRNPNDYVDLVPDATFGQVARVTQPADQGPAARTGFSPELRVLAPEPLPHVWFRFRVRFSPGWTTAGPYPAGAANSYKLAFILWKDADGRAQIEFSNTRQYVLGAYVQGVRCTELRLPGSQSFGTVSTEWTDGDWWEYVMHYQRLDATTFRAEWWRRRLTSGGRLTDGPFTYTGVERRCPSAPRVRGVALGANKNKTTPVPQFLYWGPWEVVDGSRYPNPFNLPDVP